MFSRRVQISIGLCLMVALFAAMVTINARLSWRPVTVEFAGTSTTPSAVPIGWYGQDIRFLSQLSMVGTSEEEAKKEFQQLYTSRPSRNWNRAPLPLRFSKSLQYTSEGLGTLCAAHHLFACTSGDGEIQIWRDEKLERTVREKSRARTPEGVMPEQPDVLSLSPDGKYLVSSSDLENWEGADAPKPGINVYGLVLFDVASGRQLARQGAFEGAFSDVAWSPDSREFAGLTLDGWVFVFDSPSGKVRLKFRAHQLFGAQIAWSPDGKTLVTATNSRLMMTPRNWKFDFKSGISFSFSGTSETVSGKQKLNLTKDANGEAKWNGRTERTLKRFEARTGKPIGSTLPLQTGAADMAFSPDGRELALGEHEFALILDAQTLQTKRILKALPAATGSATPAPVCVAWSENGATLATSTMRGITLWRMR